MKRPLFVIIVMEICFKGEIMKDYELEHEYEENPPFIFFRNPFKKRSIVQRTKEEWVQHNKRDN